MPDISLCRNDKCKLKKQCYRFTAKSSMWQSYTTFDCKDKSTWFIKIEK